MVSKPATSPPKARKAPRAQGPKTTSQEPKAMSYRRTLRFSPAPIHVLPRSWVVVVVRTRGLLSACMHGTVGPPVIIRPTATLC